jgi:hypothetical protein
MRILWCEQRHSNNPSPDHLRYKMMNKLGDNITFVWDDKFVDFPKEYPKENYDAVLLYFGLAEFNDKWKTLADYPVPKLMIVSDPQHEMLKHVEFVKKFNIGMLLFLCPAWIPEYKHHLDCKMVPFPWWLDDNKTDVKKDIDLAYAVEPNDYYPIEHAMHTDPRIRNMNFRKQKLGYPRLPQKEYVNVLNRSKLLVFDGSKDKIPTLKHIEGMVYKCCILAPPTDPALHLVPYENFVPITIDNYYNKILEYLDDYDAAKRIASNGRTTYLKYHTTEVRACELIQNLEMLING